MARPPTVLVLLSYYHIFCSKKRWENSFGASFLAALSDENL